MIGNRKGVVQDHGESIVLFVLAGFMQKYGDNKYFNFAEMSEILYIARQRVAVHIIDGGPFNNWTRRDDPYIIRYVQDFTGGRPRFFCGFSDGGKPAIRMANHFGCSFIAHSMQRWRAEFPRNILRSVFIYSSEDKLTRRQTLKNYAEFCDANLPVELHQQIDINDNISHYFLPTTSEWMINWILRRNEPNEIY
jgi:hypothetical protein